MFASVIAMSASDPSADEEDAVPLFTPQAGWAASLSALFPGKEQRDSGTSTRSASSHSLSRSASEGSCLNALERGMELEVLLPHSGSYSADTPPLIETVSHETPGTSFTQEMMISSPSKSTTQAGPIQNDTLFHRVPDVKRLVDEVHLQYHNVPSIALGGDEHLLGRIVANTPLPNGKSEFSSIHVIVPPRNANSMVAEKILQSIVRGNWFKVKKELHVHRLLECCCASPAPTPMEEYDTIFNLASDLIEFKADRASLVVFIGWEDSKFDFYAAVIGMLPFGGVSTALVTQRTSHEDLLTHESPSSVFAIEGSNAARIGMFPIKAAFGPLDDKTVSKAIDEWAPVDISPLVDHVDKVLHPTVQPPFKIGALTLPMLTHNGSYHDSIDALGSLLSTHYRNNYFPIVSCGETCDALGYGEDVLKACGQEHGYYFHHRSGETYECWQNYGTEELFSQIAWAKKEGLPVVIIAVGGGENGNCIGRIAACTNSHLVEVPTTPMHFNDATTSAKKAFSLVKDNKILSKNITGAFYIPELIFCVSETFLTLSSANAHATIGESCKIMNMLGMTNTSVRAQDYFNIEGGVEFASDHTKIVQHVGGFDELVTFIEDPATRKLKADILAVGIQIRLLSGTRFSAAQLRQSREELLVSLRGRYYALGDTKTNKIKENNAHHVGLHFASDVVA